MGSADGSGSTGAQRPAADDEVPGIDERRDMNLAGVEPVEGEFDQVQGDAGGRLVPRLERLFELLAAESEPDAEGVAFFPEIGHVRVAPLTGHLMGETGADHPLPVCHTVQHD